MIGNAMPDSLKPFAVMINGNNVNSPIQHKQSGTSAPPLERIAASRQNTSEFVDRGIRQPGPFVFNGRSSRRLIAAPRIKVTSQSDPRNGRMPAIVPVPDSPGIACHELLICRKLLAIIVSQHADRALGMFQLMPDSTPPKERALTGEDTIRT